MFLGFAKQTKKQPEQIEFQFVSVQSKKRIDCFEDTLYGPRSSLWPSVSSKAFFSSTALCPFYCPLFLSTAPVFYTVQPSVPFTSLCTLQGPLPPQPSPIGQGQISPWSFRRLKVGKVLCIVFFNMYIPVELPFKSFFTPQRIENYVLRYV